jgi:PKD repeat protein
MFKNMKFVKSRGGVLLGEIKVAWILVLLVVWVSPSTYSEIIPSSNLVDWKTYTGIPGGIPNRTTIFRTLSPGATTADLNNAIASCPSNQVIFLSEGTYNFGKIDMGSKKGVTLRGAGIGRTIFNSTASGSGCIENSQYSFGGAADISSGYTKGSTSIVFSATPSTEFAVGRLVSISSLDDTSFVFDREGPGRNIQTTHKILSRTGSTITFEPPLPMTLSPALRPQAEYMISGPGLQMCGIEDMSIQNSGGADIMIYWWGADSCWVKNVDLSGPVDSCVWLVDSYRCEIRQSTMRDARGAPNNPDGYGVTIYGSTASSAWHRIEDNAFSKLFVALWGKRYSCTAFLYNLCTNSVGQGFLHQRGIMNAGHGLHPMFNLWEGNIGEQWQHDGYHGSASHQTLFRNWIHGLNQNYSSNRKMLDITRGSYFYSVVGNILGDQSWADSSGFSYEMVGKPDYQSQPVIYRLGYPNMGNNDTSAAVPWPYPFTYPDPKVKATLLRHGNFDWKNKAIVWDSTISDRVIPNSLFYTSKPAYFGSCPWPPFDPATPNNAAVSNIPAGYRFVLGSNPPQGPVNNPPVARSSANPMLGVPPLTVSFSSSGSSDPEGATLTYNWNFGDGTSASTSANPSHVYQTAGSYFVRLTVSDGTNSASAPDLNIRVGNQPPVVNVSASPLSGKAPLAVIFSSSGTSDPEGAALTYSWNFGDGSANSSSANPSHTYTANGNYTARLTVSDGQNSVSSQNIQISVSDGLVAAYSFDEGTGSTIADSSANGNGGTLQGATWASTGRFGKALQFNGESTVTIGDSPSLDLTSAMTIEAWVNPTSINSDFQSIVSKPTDANFTSISYVLHGASRPNGIPSTAISGSANNLFGSSQLPLNTWSHVAATYDGSSLRLFINGQQVASQPQSGAATVSAEALRIGLGWIGSIDEVRLYNRALAASEIQSDMIRSIGGKPSAPTGLQIVP